MKHKRSTFRRFSRDRYAPQPRSLLASNPGTGGGCDRQEVVDAARRAAYGPERPTLARLEDYSRQVQRMHERARAKRQRRKP